MGGHDGGVSRRGALSTARRWSLCGLRLTRALQGSGRPPHRRRHGLHRRLLARCDRPGRCHVAATSVATMASRHRRGAVCGAPGTGKRGPRLGFLFSHCHYHDCLREGGARRQLVARCRGGGPAGARSLPRRLQRRTALPGGPQHRNSGPATRRCARSCGLGAPCRRHDPAWRGSRQPNNRHEPQALLGLLGGPAEPRLRGTGRAAPRRALPRARSGRVVADARRVELEAAPPPRPQPKGGGQQAAGCRALGGRPPVPGRPARAVPPAPGSAAEPQPGPPALARAPPRGSRCRTAGARLLSRAPQAATAATV
mmetsp:Transcript_15738/g.39316  ORF Transcript_15738/g.39316 Transcript_15738/m.39316 type:complete len:312 (+) Transcript_15738:956-1891(+)